MRIISGEKKGLNLTNIKGDWIRPTSDKIRGAIFSSLSSLFSEVEGFVDCYGGSGAMAIEAVSRGYKDVYCFDNNKKSIKIIKENLKLSDYTNKIRLINCSIQSGLDFLKRTGQKFDVFFMDPPYKDIESALKVCDNILKLSLLSDAGVIMIEHDKRDIINKIIDNFNILKEKSYGNTTITILEAK